MTNATPPDHRWHELTTMGVRDGRVTIENPLLGKRLSASVRGVVDMLVPSDAGDRGDALARGLREHGLLRDLGEDAPSNDVLDDWIRMGWRRSLEYFLWSERAEFADWDDADDSVRNEVMSGVRRKRGEPPRRLAVPRAHTVALPTTTPSATPLGDLLLGRRTHRFFDSTTAMPLPDLGAVLSTGLHSVRSARARARRVGGEEGLLETHGVGFEFFVLSYQVAELEPAIWMLDLDDLVLGRVAEGDVRQDMSEIMCGMPAALSASATIVFVADYRQLQYRYRHERALRSLYVEAGQLAQHLILAAESLGQGCLITPATNDRRLARLLDLPGERFAPLYTLTLGKKVRPGAWAKDGRTGRD